MDPEHLDGRVAALAAGQLGLVTYEQLTALGVSRKVRDARRASGRWVRIHPGVLCIAGHAGDPRRDLLAACLYTGGVVSHRSAAWLWGLDGFAHPPTRPEVAVMGDSGRRSPAIVLHQLRKLHHEDRTCRDGIPVTTAARTLCDLGLVASPRAVEHARDAARRLRLVTATLEDDRIGALSRQGRRGPNVLRDIRDADGPRSADVSWLERRVIRALRAHEIPEPTRQHPVVRPDGRRADIDLCWPRQRVALEVVGRRFHEGHRVEVEDGDRANDLESLGWHVMTVRNANLRDGGARFCRTLRRALDRPRSSDGNAP